MHQGYAAKVSQNSLDIKKLSKTDNNIVLLDNINDPRNQGAIIRNCLAFNVYDIIIEKKFYKEDNLSMHIASSGATMKTRIYEVSNLNNIIKVLKNNNFLSMVSIITGHIQLIIMILIKIKMFLFLDQRDLG